MLKLIGIAAIAGIAYMIATGNMGGAKSATQNYAEVRQKG